MILGLRDFIVAALFLFRAKARQKWLFSQLWKAFLTGVLGLIVSYSVLALSFYFLFEMFDLESYGAWAAGLGLGLVWVFLLFFGAGPLTLLLASFYLSNRGNWWALKEASNQSFFERLPKRKISLWMSPALLVLVLLSIPFSFFPIFVWVSILITAYALAQE